jgi:hypothetical protein
MMSLVIKGKLIFCGERASKSGKTIKLACPCSSLFHRSWGRLYFRHVLALLSFSQELGVALFQACPCLTQVLLVEGLLCGPEAGGKAAWV